MSYDQLLEHEPDVNAQGEDYSSALLATFVKGHEHIEWLLEQGADFYAP